VNQLALIRKLTKVKKKMYNGSQGKTTCRNHNLTTLATADTFLCS